MLIAVNRYHSHRGVSGIDSQRLTLTHFNTLRTERLSLRAVNHKLSSKLSQLGQSHRSIQSQSRRDSQNDSQTLQKTQSQLLSAVKRCQALQQSRDQLAATVETMRQYTHKLESALLSAHKRLKHS